MANDLYPYCFPHSKAWPHPRCHFQSSFTSATGAQHICYSSYRTAPSNYTALPATALYSANLSLSWCGFRKIGAPTSSAPSSPTLSHLSSIHDSMRTSSARYSPHSRTSTRVVTGPFSTQHTARFRPRRTLLRFRMSASWSISSRMNFLSTTSVFRASISRASRGRPTS